MSSLAPVSEALTAITSFVTAVAACLAAYAAWTGLNTWKKQRSAEIDAELARRILVNLHRYRDAIENVRSPFMTAYEMKPESDADFLNPLVDSKFMGKRRAYSRRWGKVQDQRSKLYADTLEANAIWGPSLSELMTEVRKLERELHSYISVYLEGSNPDEDAETRKEAKEIKRSRRNVLYSRVSVEDPFAKDFSEASMVVEKYLQSKLSRIRA